MTDITYIRTWQGWLFLAVVMDLFARKVVCWSMKPIMEKELVLDTIIMAVRRRKPTYKVVIHSDQTALTTGYASAVTTSLSRA